MTDAYVAGLIDGEGCLSMGQRKGYWYSRLDIGMTSKALPVLQRLHQQYGGSLRVQREATERWDTAHMYTVTGQRLIPLLERVIPHLVIKAEQARLLLRFCQTKERGDIVWMRCKELNRRGPAEAMPTTPPNARLLAQRVAETWLTPQRDLFSPLGWAPLSGSWPASGMASRGVCWTVDTSESPNDAVACSLSAVLEDSTTVPARFYLSPRAAAGILRRAAKRGRVLPPQLQAALESLAAGHGRP